MCLPCSLNLHNIFPSCPFGSHSYPPPATWPPIPQMDIVAVGVGGPPPGGVQYADRCAALINELNSDNPGVNDQHEFIEIKFVCPPPEDSPERLPFARYKLAIMSGTTTKPAIVFLANFQNIVGKDVPDNGKVFLVVGDPAVQPKADLLTTDSMVISAKKVRLQQQRKTRTPSLERFLVSTSTIPDGNEMPHAVLLFDCRGQKEQGIISRKLKITAIRTSIPVDRELMDFLKQHLVDMVVYGRRAYTDRCTVFEELAMVLDDRWEIDRFLPAQYVLRDWDKTGYPDRSLGRCCDTILPFQPRYFKLGYPTPGTDNDCSTAAQFYLEDILGAVAYERIDPPPTFTCAPSPEEYEEGEIDSSSGDEEVVAGTVSEMGTCTGTMSPHLYKIVQSEAVCQAREEAIGAAAETLS